MAPGNRPNAFKPLGLLRTEFRQTGDRFEQFGGAGEAGASDENGLGAGVSRAMPCLWSAVCVEDSSLVADVSSSHPGRAPGRHPRPGFLLDAATQSQFPRLDQQERG